MPKDRPLLHRLIGHNYIGPGNAIDSAEVVDNIDAVARRHDILYQAIEDSEVNLESVNSADTGSAVEFVQEGFNNIASGSASGIVSGLLGVVSGAALTAKATAEKVRGAPIYPEMAPPGKKRVHRTKASTVAPLEQTSRRRSVHISLYF